MKTATKLSKHTEDAGPKTSHPNPIHPSAGPQLDVILRTPTGSPRRNPLPKPVDLGTRPCKAKYAITVHRDTSGHAFI